MSSKFSLIVSLPDQDPKTFALDGESKSVGRGPDNDIQILISEVSVKHGSIEIDGDTCTIKDNGSTNGTKVNGEKVGPDGKALSPMDKVLMGETISCYFVPTAVLDSTPAEELIQSIEASIQFLHPTQLPTILTCIQWSTPWSRDSSTPHQIGASTQCDLDRESDTCIALHNLLCEC